MNIGKDVKSLMIKKARDIGMMEFSFCTEGMIYYDSVKTYDINDVIYRYRVSFNLNENGDNTFFKFDSMDDFLNRFEIFEIESINKTQKEEVLSSLTLKQ